MARAKKAVEVDPNKLQRERAGRYVTPDGRFAVEGPGANGWYIVDSERENELGLPLMAGPYATLDEARDLIPGLRDGAPPSPRTDAGPHADAAEPLAEPADPVEPPAAPDDRRSRRSRPTLVRNEAPDADADEPATASDDGDSATPPQVRTTRAAASNRPAAAAARRPAVRGHDTAPKPSEPAEPVWLARLDDSQRAEARRLLALLEKIGIDDPAIVRRDLEADQPEVATILLSTAVRTAALDPWRVPDDLLERVASVDRDLRRHLRPAVEPAIDAAERAVQSAESPTDLASFAWLVALRTAAAVFEAIDQEGRDGRQTGEPGWRLLELDGRREPTRRAITVEASDLVEPTGGDG